MAEHDYDDILRGLGSRAIPPDVERMAQDVADRVRRNLVQTQPSEHHKWKAYIMGNRKIQLAAAAVIVVAVLLGLHRLGAPLDGTSVVWGDVLEKLENVPVVSYKVELTMTYPEGRRWVDASDVYVSKQYGSRIDSYQEGQLYMIKYLLPARKIAYIVHPQLKRYFERTLSEEQAAVMIEQQDPRQWLEWILTWEHHELGRREVDGVEVEGIEAQRQDKETMRVWVDVQTNWPVRIESEGQMMNEGQFRPTYMVMDHFNWTDENDPRLFEPNIPADYTLSPPR